jgi:TRAP-type C4-dicarboxylate transport system substrate-binding protein
MIAMRKDKFDALPAEARESIEKHSGDVFSRRLAPVFDDIELKYADDIGKSGKNRVVNPSPAELESWKTALHPVVQEWREAAPKNEKIPVVLGGTRQVSRRPVSDRQRGQLGTVAWPE